MIGRILPVMACLAVMSQVSCNKPAPAAVPPSPSCAIEAVRTIPVGGGTELRVWNLKMSGLKRLTARLLIATDGTAQTADEVEYRWDEWGPDSPAASGELVLVVQDGKAFRAPGRRSLLGLDVQGSPSHVRTGRSQGVTVGGDLRPQMAAASVVGPAQGRGCVYAELFSPPTDDGAGGSIGLDPESVAASSRGGRTVVAVALEWEPR